MTRPAALLVSCVASTLLVSCGSKPPTAPSTPATVTSLAISAPPASLRAGDTHQLTATATFSNGQTATTGFTVTWSTSDANVATVSGNGLVTAKADGRATISAAVNTISASADFLIRGGRTLTGIVTETAPTTSVMVAGARVTVTDGLYAGISATTDASGAFTLEEVNGVVNLRISAPHFDDALVTADTAATGPLTVRLLPAARTVTDVAESGHGFKSVPTVTMTFDMHRSGRVDLSLYASLSPGGDAGGFCGDIHDEAGTLVWSGRGGFWFTGLTTTISLDGGKRYTLAVHSRCFYSAVVTQYRLSVTHPY
jgi:hypothetical protein